MNDYGEIAGLLAWSAISGIAAGRCAQPTGWSCGVCGEVYCIVHADLFVQAVL